MPHKIGHPQRVHVKSIADSYITRSENLYCIVQPWAMSNDSWNDFEVLLDSCSHQPLLFASFSANDPMRSMWNNEKRDGSQRLGTPRGPARLSQAVKTQVRSTNHNTSVGPGGVPCPCDS